MLTRESCTSGPGLTPFAHHFVVCSRAVEIRGYESLGSLETEGGGGQLQVVLVPECAFTAFIGSILSHLLGKELQKQRLPRAQPCLRESYRRPPHCATRCPVLGLPPVSGVPPCTGLKQTLPTTVGHEGLAPELSHIRSGNMTRMRVIIRLWDSPCIPCSPAAPKLPYRHNGLQKPLRYSPSFNKPSLPTTGCTAAVRYARSGSSFWLSGCDNLFDLTYKYI